MSYEFLKKAQQQPDLEDTVVYLEKPLKILDTLFENYQSISLKSKTKVENLDAYYQAEKIVNYYLPNLINRYCEFSLQYRNQEIIKTETKHGKTVQYTAKELLLADLAKIIEEINILNHQFNEANKFEFLVNNRIISSLGEQPDILKNHPEKKVVLENGFEYEKYEEPIPVKKQEAFMEQHFVKPEESITSNIEAAISKKPFGISDIILVIGFMAIAMIILFMSVGKVKNTVTEQTLLQNLENLQLYSHLYYSKSSNKIITPQQIAKDFGDLPSLNNPFGGNIVLESATVSRPHDAYKISVANIPSNSCLNLSETLGRKFKNVTINDKHMPYSTILNEKAVTSVCSLEQNTISLTEQIR